MIRPVFLALSLGLAATPALAEVSISVVHDAVPAPVLLDLGPEGPSPGDQRIFSFPGTDSTGQPVHMYGVMTTLALAGAADAFDVRSNAMTFAFAGGTILTQGLGLYPPQGSTLAAETVLERAVIGGTGEFAGARGTLVSRHLPDDTWEHEFHLH
ncbi:MAG: hypothetical protein IT542_02060 [Rubellimicrobium sp.]|nr:hypothetical protein [Rubellimicrobium sp.]